MDIEPEYFNQRKGAAKAHYTSQKSIWSPYFTEQIILNSDGFHHLQFSARRERNKKEQLFKFSLLPLGLEIIKGIKPQGKPWTRPESTRSSSAASRGVFNPYVAVARSVM